MSDKTKFQLIAKLPEAIACKAESKKLYKQLLDANVELTGVGVGISDDNQKSVIQVYLLKSSDVSKVPTTFNNYEVKVVVTGVIRAL